MAEQLLTLSTMAEREDGSIVFVSKGETLPDDVKPAVLKRLRDKGAYGELPAEDGEPSNPSDLVAADEGSLAEYVESHTVDEIKNAVGDDAELAQRVLDLEEKSAKPRKGLVEHLEDVIDDE